METITSRKNPYIRLLRELAADAETRKARGLYLCEGIKMLREALQFGASVESVLWKERAGEVEGLRCAEQYLAPAELFDYAAPLKNSPGPLFAVRIRGCSKPGRLSNAVVLENVQDPGNVGTVVRTANAFGIGAVILAGSCADLYHPKTVRATMGAIFRQPVLSMDTALLKPFLDDQGLPLYGAALSDQARDIRDCPVKRCAAAVGSEGRGLSEELLSLCDGQLIIPMSPNSESLNAAVAASVIMWEMAR